MQQFLPGYGNYNPMMSAQQRLNQLEAQYPQFSQNQVQQPVQQQTQTLVTIPVSNVEEANAFRVDLNGTPTFFYNAGKNEIYLKRTNMQTGLADFIKFQRIVEPSVEEKPSIDINTYKEDFKLLNDKLDGLYSLLATVPNKPKIETVEKGNKNAK